MHAIKPLHRATSADVRILARAAAERGEPPDAANVFPVGTNNHAVFTTEWMARMFELEDCADILVLDRLIPRVEKAVDTEIHRATVLLRCHE